MWKPLQVDERDVDERDDKGGTDEAGEACEKDDDLLDKICDVLKSREDGFFLAYHYMKRRYWRYFFPSLSLTLSPNSLKFWLS